MYADDKKHESIHTTQWPTVQKELIDPETEKIGDLIVAVMGEIRRDKAENQKPLNVAIHKLTLYSEDKQILDVLCGAEEDLAGTCKIEKMEAVSAKGEGREVQGYPNVRFVAEY
jgi:valyl-tRNA synthetase